MKLSPLLLFPVLALPIAAQISIGDNLALEGAGSFGFVSQDSTASGESSSLGFQEIILGLEFNLNQLDAEVILELDDGTAEVDAVFFNYAYSDIVSISAGRMYSLLLYEDILLTQRLTRSLAHTLLEEIVPAANTGIRGIAETEKGWVSVGWTDKIWDQPTDRSGLLNGGNGAVELQLGFLPFSGLEIALTYGGQDSGDSGPSGQMWDFWIQHEGEKHLLVAEYVDFENAGAQDADSNGAFANSEYLSGKSWMLLGSYKTTPVSSMTFRVSHEEQDGVQEAFKWAVVPAYEFSDNLTLRAEFSHETQESPGAVDMEVDIFSVEGLLRF